MIDFAKYKLDNGLTLIIHEDHNIPMAVVNTLYDVGSRDEDENKTGFAHLFEHLMFGGSKHVKAFDELLQQVGGDNNAFTSPDITNYYVTLPAPNIETAFWLESDRMLELSFDPNVLEVQRKVVIEEFKQRYLNQPYGDMWLHLRPLAYTKHSYKWPTIGKEIEHIENATMEDVQAFFYNHYAPNNAYLVVAGDVDKNKTYELVNKWYGDIPRRDVPMRNITQEPKQSSYRRTTVESNVPANALYMAFHMPGRTQSNYYEADLLSDLLGRGYSAHLTQSLVKKHKTFSTINSYITGSHDPGLLVINGKINPGISIEEAEQQIWDVIRELNTKGFTDSEYQKIKNQAESSYLFGESELLNRAISLAIATALGNTNLVNEEIELIKAVTKEGMMEVATTILNAENCAVIHYKSLNNN